MEPYWHANEIKTRSDRLDTFWSSNSFQRESHGWALCWERNPPGECIQKHISYSLTKFLPSQHEIKTLPHLLLTNAADNVSKVTLTLLLNVPLKNSLSSFTSIHFISEMSFLSTCHLETTLRPNQFMMDKIKFHHSFSSYRISRFTQRWVTLGCKYYCWLNAIYDSLNVSWAVLKRWYNRKRNIPEECERARERRQIQINVMLCVGDRGGGVTCEGATGRENYRVWIFVLVFTAHPSFPWITSLHPCISLFILQPSSFLSFYGSLFLSIILKCSSSAEQIRGVGTVWKVGGTLTWKVMIISQNVGIWT